MDIPHRVHDCDVDSIESAFYRDGSGIHRLAGQQSAQQLAQILRFDTLNRGGQRRQHASCDP